MVVVGMTIALACVALLFPLGIWATHFVAAAAFPLVCRVAIFAGLDDSDHLLRNASAVFDKMGTEVLFFGSQRWLADAEQFVLLALWLCSVVFLLFERRLAAAAITLLGVPLAPLCLTLLLGVSGALLGIVGLIVDAFYWLLPLTPDPQRPSAVALFPQVVRVLWAYEAGFYTLLLNLCTFIGAAAGCALSLLVPCWLLCRTLRQDIEETVHDYQV